MTQAEQRQEIAAMLNLHPLEPWPLALLDRLAELRAADMRAFLFELRSLHRDGNN
jgi:hypothetical protein